MEMDQVLGEFEKKLTKAGRGRGSIKAEGQCGFVWAPQRVRGDSWFSSEVVLSAHYCYS